VVYAAAWGRRRNNLELERMITRVFWLAVLATGISGCAFDDAGRDASHIMANASELCRAAAENASGRNGAPLAASERDEHLAFTRRYRDCMADKGYTISEQAN
jgi:hypothetical protein